MTDHTLKNSTLRRVKGELVMDLTGQLWREISACIPAYRPRPGLPGPDLTSWKVEQEIADCFNNLLEENEDLRILNSGNL